MTPNPGLSDKHYNLIGYTDADCGGTVELSRLLTAGACRGTSYFNGATSLGIMSTVDTGFTVKISGFSLPGCKVKDLQFNTTFVADGNLYCVVPDGPEDVVYFDLEKIA